MADIAACMDNYTTFNPKRYQSSFDGIHEDLRPVLAFYWLTLSTFALALILWGVGLGLEKRAERIASVQRDYFT